MAKHLPASPDLNILIISFDAVTRTTIADPCSLLKGAIRGRASEDLLSPEQIEQLRSLGHIQ